MEWFRIVLKIHSYHAQCLSLLHVVCLGLSWPLRWNEGSILWQCSIANSARRCCRHFCHGQLTSPLLLLRICPKRICPKDQLVIAMYCSYCSKSGKFRLSFLAQLRYPWCCSFFKRPVKLDSMLTAHVQSNTALKEENSSIGFSTTIPCNIGFHTLYTSIEEISVRGNHDADS